MANCILNEYILWNKILCAKLNKSFGMRYSTSYADPGLNVREQHNSTRRTLSGQPLPSTNRAQRYLTLVIK
jgi:hypothetical protein